MFFILSKIFVVLLVPLNWIMLLLIWRFFAKSNTIKRRLEILIIVVLVVFGNELLLNKLVNAWQSSPVTLPASTAYSAGIILGGYESYDRNGNGYFNASSDRFIQTVKLYRQGHIKKIVISGSRVEDFKVQPSQFVRTQLLSMGIPATDILFDDLSKNTFENAVFSKRLLDSAGLKPPYVLITSAWHMPRAKNVFIKTGLQVIAYPCNYVMLDKKFEWDDYFWPKSFVLDQWSYYLKEIFGTLIYSWFNKA